MRICCIAQETLLELCGDPHGKEIQKRGDICTAMADSFCCTVETNTTLESNYILIASKKKKKTTVQRIQVFPSYLDWILHLAFTVPFKLSELWRSWKIGTKSIGLSYHTRYWHSVNGSFPSLPFFFFSAQFVVSSYFYPLHPVFLSITNTTTTTYIIVSVFVQHLTA